MINSDNSQIKSEEQRMNALRLLQQSEASDVNWKVVSIAILASLLFHVLIFFTIPKEFSKKLPSKIEELQLDILPPEIEQRKMPEYIEANPYANQLEPESKNSKESFINQRAADEIADKTSKSKMPYVGGDSKESQKIVSGNLNENSKPVEAMQITEINKRPLTPPTLMPVDTSKSMQGEKSDSSGGDAQKEKIQSSVSEGKNAQKKESLNSTKDLKDQISEVDLNEKGEIKIPKNLVSDGKSDKNAAKDLANKENRLAEKLADKLGEGEKKAEAESKKEEKKPVEKPKELPQPKPRPSLNMRIAPGPLSDNKTRASMQGVLGVDSRFSEFGAYQQRMIEAISRQWNLLGDSYNLGSAVGTRIIIEFYLNTKGELTKIDVTFSNTTQTGRALCEQSILSTAPYGAWTQDMIDSLGTQDQLVRITFHYR